MELQQPLRRVSTAATEKNNCYGAHRNFAVPHSGRATVDSIALALLFYVSKVYLVI